MVLNKAVPSRIREGLNAESGRNDGLAVPILLHGLYDWPLLTVRRLEQLGVEREAARNPVFQVLFGLHSEALEQLDPGGVGPRVSHGVDQIRVLVASDTNSDDQ